ncbi:unnamed protein product [Closterium sp. NIES-65]|nr:unnamed protein product [Closterium sp. NIES-65]
MRSLSCAMRDRQLNLIPLVLILVIGRCIAHPRSAPRRVLAATGSNASPSDEASEGRPNDLNDAVAWKASAHAAPLDDSNAEMKLAAPLFANHHRAVNAWAARTNYRGGSTAAPMTKRRFASGTFRMAGRSDMAIRHYSSPPRHGRGGGMNGGGVRPGGGAQVGAQYVTHGSAQQHPSRGGTTHHLKRNAPRQQHVGFHQTAEKEVSLRHTLSNGDNSARLGKDSMKHGVNGDGSGDGGDASGDAAEPSATFSVTEFGGGGGGSSDDSKAFAAAFTVACKKASSSDKKSRVVVPSGQTFLVKPVVFEGPCGPGVQFTIDGTIVAPGDPGEFDNPGSGTYGVLNFRGIPGLEIVGGGLVDGNAEAWWKKGGDERPQNIVIVECHRVLVTGITSKDPAFKHLFLYKNNGVTVRSVTTLSPEESPNTDSLHLSYVQDALIENCEFSGGDDNVAIINGTSRVLIQNIVGNSGHGISIGSLGKDEDISCVSDITVRRSILRNTANGLRIKTWQGGKGTARKIHFEDMILENVGHPIRIDQFYCNSESSRSCGTSHDAVAISDVTFKNVKGTTSKGEGIKIDCSDTVPCSNILLSDISIQPVEGGEQLQPFLNSAYVSIEGPVVPELKDVKSSLSPGLLSAIEEMQGYC